MLFRIQDFHRRFGSSDRCLQYLFEKRFSSAACPKCGRKGSYHRHPAKPCYTCNCGQSHIYPRKGTLFEESAVPITKWFYAVFLLSQTSQGISAKDLERRLKVTYPTAWRMARKIRALKERAEQGRKPLPFLSLLACCIENDAA